MKYMSIEDALEIADSFLGGYTEEEIEYGRHHVDFPLEHPKAAWVLKNYNNNNLEFNEDLEEEEDSKFIIEPARTGWGKGVEEW